MKIFHGYSNKNLLNQEASQKNIWIQRNPKQPKKIPEIAMCFCFRSAFFLQEISPGATVQTSPCKRKDSQRFIFSQGLKGHDHLVCTDFMHNRLGKPGKPHAKNATQRNVFGILSPNILQFTPTKSPVPVHCTMLLGQNSVRSTLPS